MSSLLPRYMMDTDHLSLLDRDTIEGFEIGRRAAMLPPEEICVSIITYEEQMRGWLAYLAQAKTAEQQLRGYRKLREHIERYRVIPVIDFDARAIAEWERLRKLLPRGGAMDLKIAATALANNAILLTRNTKDFEKVPGLQIEDWTQ